MADTKGGPFDITPGVAQAMLAAPVNPNGRPNSDVVRPWMNGQDITRRPRGMWIIDFGVDMPIEEAALYELHFRYVETHVKSVRAVSKSTISEWWLHERSRPEMRAAIARLPRYIGTSSVAKHRLFAWLRHPTLPDHAIIVVARDDDYCLGVLQSRAHILWADRMGTSLEDRPRYTPSTTFETFPFPWPLGSEPQDDARTQAVAAAASDLMDKRERWLNPPDASQGDLNKRTLTNLYNQRPTWLDMAHQRLDRAVFDAYGWPHDLSDEQILERLLALNLERSAPM